MKVLAINASPRKSGNTHLLLEKMTNQLTAVGHETKIFQLGGKPVHGCMVCMKCREAKDMRCHIKNETINNCIQEMAKADAIILGSPVYFADITTEMKALIDICGFVNSGNNRFLSRKIGAGVVAVRRGGQLHALNSLNNFFMITGMIVPGSTYWNFAYGESIGDVLNDKEGINTINNLAENIDWLLKKLN